MAWLDWGLGQVFLLVCCLKVPGQTLVVHSALKIDLTVLGAGTEMDRAISF